MAVLLSLTDLVWRPRTLPERADGPGGPPPTSTNYRATSADVRQRLIEADLVDCIVSLPERLFFNTGIPVALWFISKARHGNGHRRRPGEVLFIDARHVGTMETRRLRVLSDDDITQIAGTYHAWRNHHGGYTDVPGFARVARTVEIADQDYVLTPSRYVGSSDNHSDPNAPEAIAQRVYLVGDARRMLAESHTVQRQAEDALSELAQAIEINEWHEVQVGDVARVIGGGTPPSRDGENFGGDIPWITPKDLTTHQGRYISRGARSLTEAGLSNSSAKLLPAGSVLVSSRAPIGLVAIASAPVATNQGIRSLILDETQDATFWYYLLRQSTSLLDAHANGSTFREISGGSLAKLTFTVPSLEWQRRLALTLSRLDELIEHNLEINNSLATLSKLGAQYAVRRSE